jgi:hypothetical protein
LNGLQASTGRARAIRFAWSMPAESAVAHGGPGIEELCDWLIARTGATPEVIGVAIEMTHGPVVEALLERGFCAYGINPKQLDRFRDRFTVAGAKDDRRDAHDRGLELSPLDLVKNFLFSRVSNDITMLRDMEDRWTQMMSTLANVRADNFLKAFWTSRHG